MAERYITQYPLTGTVRGYEKKFKGEWLQKDYADLTEKFGEEQHTIRRALDCLEELGVIKKHLCTVLIENKKTDDKNAKKCNNVLFIELCPDVLKQITFSLPDGNESEPQNNVSKYDEKEEEDSDEDEAEAEEKSEDDSDEEKDEEESASEVAEKTETEDEKKKMLSEAKSATAWVYEIIKKICKEEEK